MRLRSLIREATVLTSEWWRKRCVESPAKGSRERRRSAVPLSESDAKGSVDPVEVEALATSTQDERKEPDEERCGSSD